MSRYQSTMSSPNHRPTTPPRARNGPNGTACLRACDAVARDQHPADQGPAREPDQQRRRDRAPEVDRHHRHQLGVAHPHPPRVGSAIRNSAPPAAATRDRALARGRRGRTRARSRCPAIAPASTIALGMIRVLEVGQRDRHQHGAERQPEHQLAGVVGAERQDRARPQGAQAGLGQRVARRDRRPAASGSAHAAPARRRSGRCRRRRSARRSPGSGSAPSRSPLPRGTRCATTVTKLPMNAPATKAIAASPSISATTLNPRTPARNHAPGRAQQASEPVCPGRRPSRGRRASSTRPGRTGTAAPERRGGRRSCSP